MTRLKDRFAAGETAHGVWVSLASSYSAELCSRAGFDYACIDMQHGLADYSHVVSMIQAIDLGDATPIVRVPWNEQGIIGRVLDAGALGVIIPMVNTVEQAEAAAASCRYAPAGKRSFGPIRAAARDGGGYWQDANDRIACIPMIETTEAISNLDAILAVPGIDAVYVGPADLSLTLGLPPGNNDDEATFTEAIEHIAGTARSHGVVPGIHSTPGLTPKRRDQGFGMITVTSDGTILGAGLRADLREGTEGTGDGGSGSMY